MTQHGTRQWWQAVVLTIVVCAAYANSLQGSFQYDDFHSIVRNSSLRDLGNLPAFFTDPETFSGDADKAMYRPLLLASLALNHALHGYKVEGYHAVNVMLHLACVMLLWRLARRLTTTGAALAAALLFATHPLTAEPVNYISSRSELLLGVFFLGSLWVHCEAGTRGRLHVLAAVLCALALLSKATAVMLAPSLLLFDLIAMGWRPARASDLLRRHGVYWVLSGVYVGTIALNGFLGDSLAAPVRGVVAQTFTQIKAWTFYVRLLVMPRPLSVDHTFNEATTVGVGVILGAVLLGSLLWLVARSWRGLPATMAGILVAGLVLLPTSMMPLNVLINERRLYLVVAALCLSLVTLARVRHNALLAATILFVLLTVQRNGAWATQTTLWESAQRSGSYSYRTWVNLGKAYQEAGDAAAARRAYERALELDDRHGDVYNNLAVLLHRSGSVAQAVPWYEQALSRYPEMDEIYQNLADAHVQLGEYERAESVYAAALRLDDDNGSVWNNLGDVRMKQRDYAGAEIAFQRAQQLLPNSHEPANNLGNALDAQGSRRRPAAIIAYRRALGLAPDDGARGAIYANLGETLRRSDEHEKAVTLLDSSLSLAPTAGAYDYRGRVAYDLGDLHGADRFWRLAVGLDPGLGTAWTGLGELALGAGDVVGAEGSLQLAAESGGGVRAWGSLARCLEVLGRVDDARNAYRQVVARGHADDPRVARARLRLQALDETR